MLERCLLDLRQGMRALSRQPFFALAAALTLSCGVAATALVASAGDAILLRPLDVRQPEQLFVVRRQGEPRARFPLAFHQALRSSNGPFAAVAARFTFPITVVQGATGTRASAAFVSDDYFRMLGVDARLGRVFTEERDLVVISDQFLKDAFNGEVDVLGRALRVGGGTFTVAGVLPRGFHGLQRDLAIDIWIPLSQVPAAVPIEGFRPAVDLVVRVAPEIPPSAAASRLSTEFERWARINPRHAGDRTRTILTLVPAAHGLDNALREQFGSAFPMLIALAACLWLIALVNVAGLLNARMRGRAREIGVRLALGATRARMFAQLLAESAVLVIGGIGFGVAATALLVARLPSWLPAWSGVHVRVSLLTLGVTVLSGMLAAVCIAVLQTVSVDRGRILAELARGMFAASRRRLSTATRLVTAQIALTLPLVVAAGLLGQTLYRLHRTDTGFLRNELLQVGVEPLLAGYPAERSRAYYADALDRLRSTPGVVDAAVSSGGALSGFDGRSRLRHEGTTHDVRLNAVGDRYFRTLNIRTHAGRTFEAEERHPGPGGVVLNVTLARRLFGSEPMAIGRTITLLSGNVASARKVIGVVDNTADVDLRRREEPAVYERVGESPLLVIHVRTAIEATSIIPAVRQTLMSLDPKVPILGIHTIEDRRWRALQRERLLGAIAAVAGWLALALSAISVFGRSSHDVSSRVREIGIRCALGARPPDIAALFLKRTLGMLAAGLPAGAILALVAARSLRAFLYGYGANLDDPAIYTSATILLTATVVLATLLPVGRALGATTAANLRQE